MKKQVNIEKYRKRLRIINSSVSSFEDLNYSEEPRTPPAPHKSFVGIYN
jgi:hypothetical protein